MRRASLAAAGLACFVAAVAPAPTPRPASAAEDPYAGVEVLRGLFASNDYNGDGRISMRELNLFTEFAFVSSDADADARVSLEEFMAWDPGFATLAEYRGKAQAYEAAKREVFGARDRDGDGGLDEAELSVNAAHDFVVADRDRNGSLDPGEFAAGYPILAVIARALR